MVNQFLVKAIVLVIFSIVICMLFSLPFRYAVLHWLEQALEGFGSQARPRRRGISDFEALSNRQEASAELQQQLLALVKGDRDRAEQWVTKARFGHSGQPEDYYWGRAIELLRDSESKR